MVCQKQRLIKSQGRDQRLPFRGNLTAIFTCTTVSIILKGVGATNL